MDEDPAAYVERLTRDDLPAKELEGYKRAWPMHRGFGAACDPQAFHLPGMWGVRQHPFLYEVASRLLGSRGLWVTIDRCIQKLPGEGQAEFLHWDVDYLGEDRPERETSVSGKVMYTSGSFVAVPRTATRAFQDEFRARYGERYASQRGKKKLGLREDLHSDCERVTLRLPAGSVVFWSPWLLHGVVENPRRGHVAFGMYLGYALAGPREEYRRRAGIGEAEDRVASLVEGRAPRLFPSMDVVHYYPAAFKTYARKALRAYVARVRPDWPGLLLSSREEADLVPVPTPQPVVLSPLGHLLLGTP